MSRLGELFTIEGRLGRGPYGWRAGLSLGWIIYYGFYDRVVRGPGGPILVVSTPMVVAWFAAAWILYVASVRRIRDIGWGSWTVAVPIGLALGTGRIEELIGSRTALDVGNAIGAIVMVLFVLVAALPPGQVGEARSGPDTQDLPPEA